MMSIVQAVTARVLSREQQPVVVESANGIAPFAQRFGTHVEACKLDCALHAGPGRELGELRRGGLGLFLPHVEVGHRRGAP